MKKYSHIFFDLDHTLWDFDKNSREALAELVDKYKIHKANGFEFESFLERFKKANLEMWALYTKDLINAEELRRKRLDLAFENVDIHLEPIYERFSADYISCCSTKGHLLDNAREVLESLHERYSLYILTNGFEKVQYTKLITSNIFHYFDEVFTTADTNGIKKPNPLFFEYAIQKAGGRTKQLIMVGDTLDVDIHGAQESGLDTVYFNPDATPHSTPDITYEIKNLSELLDIF